MFIETSVLEEKIRKIYGYGGCTDIQEHECMRPPGPSQTWAGYKILTRLPKPSRHRKHYFA